MSPALDRDTFSPKGNISGAGLPAGLGARCGQKRSVVHVLEKI